jgi:hypothetical protein
MKGEKMKGIFVGTVLLIAILTLIISGVFFIVLNSEYINLKVSLKASEVLKSSDVVEVVKKGLEIAYNYSFFQAAYEVGKLGGYNDEKDIKEWRIYDNTYFPESYVEYVRKRTENYIEEYFKALEEEIKEFKFPQPSVNFLFFKNGENVVKMIVTFPSLFSYSIYFFTIYDNPNRTIYPPIDYFKLYDTAYKLFIEKDSVREDIDKAEERMDEKCRKIYLDGLCEQYKKDREAVLEENCPNADEKFKEKVINEVETPESNDVNINLHVNAIEVRHESYEWYSRLSESIDCGCKRYGTFCKEYDENGQCKQWITVCVEYYKKYYDLVYFYSYFAAVKVTSNVSTKGQYPVYDATERNTKFRNFILTFNLTTSNDYNWKPI